MLFHAILAAISAALPRTTENSYFVTSIRRELGFHLSRPPILPPNISKKSCFIGDTFLDLIFLKLKLFFCEKYDLGAPFGAEWGAKWRPKTPKRRQQLKKLHTSEPQKRFRRPAVAPEAARSVPRPHFLDLDGPPGNGNFLLQFVVKTDLNPVLVTLGSFWDSFKEFPLRFYSKLCMSSTWLALKISILAAVP